MIPGSAFTKEFANNPALVHASRRKVTISDRDWYNGRFFNRYIKPAHQDDALMTRVRRGNEMHLLVVQRAIGEPYFEHRHVRLARLLAVEWAHSFGTTLAPRDGFSLRHLPPRLRDVLACLMQGDSEKQTALRLGISHHTVHDYVKQLHKRFGVQNRGELLARCRQNWCEDLHRIGKTQRSDERRLIGDSRPLRES
jgi:DNA-binding CsgD family transcriptional regulator